MDDTIPLSGLFAPIKHVKCERTAKVDVWVVTHVGETLRRFRSEVEAQAYAHLRGRLSKVSKVRGSARDLFRWGLGPAPEHYRKPVPKPVRRRRVVACPHCPHCLAKRKGEPEPTPSPYPIEPEGYHPDIARELAERPDLGKLFDKRLHEPLPDDY